jgi:hypothetical protein
MRWFDKVGFAVLVAGVAVIAASIVQDSVAMHGHGAWIDLLWWLRR